MGAVEGKKRMGARGPSQRWVTIGAVGVLALLCGAMLPVLAAGAATSITPVVSRGAALSIHPFVASNTHDYNVSATACYRGGNGVDLCNVTVSVNLSSACAGPGARCHELLAYNYSVLGQNTAPLSFYVINSDPTLPIPGLNVSPPGCKVGCGSSSVTLGVWFHVNQPTGTISVWLQLDTLT